MTALLRCLILALVAACGGAAHAQPGNGIALVRREIQALNDGDVAGVLQTFDADALIFQVPSVAYSLVGDLPQKIGSQPKRTIYFQQLLAKELLPRNSIMNFIEVGDLVAVKLRIVRPADLAKADYSLFIYRTGKSRIKDVWHVARAKADPDEAPQLEVVRRLIAASNEVNVEQFIANFSNDARHFESSGRAHAIADRPIERLSGQANLRRAITKAFAGGSRSHATRIAAFAVADLVVSQDRVVMPDGAVVNQLKVYRIRDGSITYDWTVYEG